MTRARRRGTASGFTLLEILIVLAVLALVLSLILRRGPLTSPALSVRGAAGQVAQALRTARSEAIAEGHPVALLLNPALRVYVTTGTAPRVLHAPPSMLIVAPANGISFMPDGSSSGGAIAVEQAGHRAEINVNWLTGLVSVSETRSGD
jgi:general secretion pathway protein H